MLHEREQPVADRVPRRLVAGDHQQAEVVVELALGQDPLALRHRERGDRVVLWLLEPEVTLPVRVLEHLERDGGAEREVAVLLRVDLVHDRVRELRVLVADHRVAPADQHRRVLLRDGEDRAQEPDRELARDLGDEVELLVLQGVVEHPSGDVPDEVLVRADAPGGEPLVADVAELAMPRRVGLEHRLADPQLLLVEFLERDGALLGREGLPIHVDRDEVVVPRDRPEAVVRSGLRMPGDRCGSPELVEPFERDPLDVAVGVHQVHPGQVDLGRDAHRGAPIRQVSIRSRGGSSRSPTG